MVFIFLIKDTDNQGLFNRFFAKKCCLYILKILEFIDKIFSHYVGAVEITQDKRPVYIRTTKLQHFTIFIRIISKSNYYKVRFIILKMIKISIKWKWSVMLEINIPKEVPQGTLNQILLSNDAESFVTLVDFVIRQ